MTIDQGNLFGCIGCGHCMAACPSGAISVSGRDFLPGDVVPLPERDNCADYEKLYSLMLRRRSIRSFTGQQVSQELVDRLVSAASTAPMGLPPSDTAITVFLCREKMQAFVDDITMAIKKYRWMFGKVPTALVGPFMGKDFVESVDTFIRPAFDTFIKEREENNKDVLLYDAPLGMLFSVHKNADPADPYINATYAMLAAEALGLGSIMLGVPGSILSVSKELKEKYKLQNAGKSMLFVSFGYPENHYFKAIKRRFAKVDYV